MSEQGHSPSVSVIIVCHNDGKWLPHCLESIRAQTIFDRSEVIIADNASEDGSDKLARELIAGWPNAVFLPTGGDNGFGVACNRAAQIARGKYLYFLNPDLWLEPDCLQKLFETAEREQAAAVAGSVLEYDDNTVQVRSSSGFDLFGNGMAVSDATKPDAVFFAACFQFIRRDVFQKIGMMDDKFFMYGEETDLGWRIWIAGGKIVPGFAAKVHHRGAVGVNPEGGTKAVENRTSAHKRFLANRNRLLCLAKNCRHVLLLMLVPCAATVLLEGLMTLAMTRKWSLAKATCFDALAGLWRLRGHVCEQRRRIAAFRRRGDFWMLRFFRFGFGRWDEVKKILRAGFPRFR